MSEASSAAETGRSPAHRNRLALTLAAVSILALGAWLADRLTHIYVTDARISATMVALSARVPGWVREVPVEEGAEVTEGAALLQLDDEMAALIHAGLLQKVEALEAEHESLSRQRTMAERQTASRHAGQAAELRAAEAKAQAYAHDLEQAEAA
ncbi:MAG: biotin/lipoyl-binding protein [Pseudomonadales bacterium]